ncbi:carbohydrate ABC transporter permease [Sanguibacter sp. A247]|uniref:carbohydrate ABC transporter permease n=1 Tax=unclassified Sanguibacter TaxID=2645534 RepID=UPI003FD7DDC5
MSDVLARAPQSRRAPTGRRPVPSTQRARRATAIAPYLLVLPVVLMMVIALGYPLVRQFVMSFQEYGLKQQFGADPEWIGLDNYEAIFADSAVWAVIIRSLLFCLVAASATMVAGMAVAVLLTKVATWLRITIQSVLLVAWAMPVIASMTVWQWLFDTNYGVINWVLAKIGLSQFQGHSWLIDPLSFLTIAALVVVWMSVPFVAFSLNAALTQVSGEQLEAAELDGANAWERFRHIKLPTIMPVVMVVSLLQVIWDLRVFAQIYYLQMAGGVASETNLLGTYIYNLGLGQGDFGKAAAVAIFMLALTLGLTFFYVRKLAKEV